MIKLCEMHTNYTISNVIDLSNRKSPLVLACLQSRLETVNYLLKSEYFGINLTDMFDCTLLIVACEKNIIELRTNIYLSFY